MTFAKASVIVPAYNAAATIGECLEAVLSQIYAGEVELIVVDDGSVDATAAVVRSYRGVKYVFQENRGPASARNRGAACASGDLLLFTDSDCRPEPGWIQGMADGFQDDSVGVVAGSYAIANEGMALPRIIHGEIRFRHLRLMPSYPRVFGSYNFAVSADLFRHIGGFNAVYRQASGEDNDLSYRILRSGRKIRFLKDVCVAHYHQHILWKYLREQFRHGFWRASLYLDHASMAAGDDYTFWKDIVELPLALGHVACLFWPPVFLAVLAVFLAFEGVFGLWLFGVSADGFLAGGVMWLRAFARAAGFVFGGLDALRRKYGKG